LSDFWMHTRSTNVAHGPPCSFKLQHLIPLLKYSISNVLTYICPWLWNVKIAFSHDIALLPHTPNMTMNVAVISLPMAEFSSL
jgi:hypothetical protein